MRRTADKCLNVEAVEKPVDNLSTENIEAESLLILFWQRFMTLVITYKRILSDVFYSIKRLFVFLQPRYVNI